MGHAHTGIAAATARAVGVVVAGLLSVILIGFRAGAAIGRGLDSRAAAAAGARKPYGAVGATDAVGLLRAHAEAVGLGYGRSGLAIGVVAGGVDAAFAWPVGAAAAGTAIRVAAFGGAVAVCARVSAALLRALVAGRSVTAGVAARGAGAGLGAVAVRGALAVGGAIAVAVA